MLEMLKARKEELQAQGKKGFTLMEMLIVIAIIAVLIAIAIPVFTSQLENAREATDEANIRAAYAEIMAKGLTETTPPAAMTVNLQQQEDGWGKTPSWPSNLTESGTPKAGKTASVALNDDKNGVVVTYNS